ncbi:MAG: hypothetical protein V1809_02565 [Planctomycetota bacterium]
MFVREDDRPRRVSMNANREYDGRFEAALCYLIPFYFLVPLLRRGSPLARFHARQALFLGCLVILGIFLSSVLIPFFGIGLFLLFGIAPFVAPEAYWMFCFGILPMTVVFLHAVGFVNAARGLARPIPVVGLYVDVWLPEI